MTRLMLGIAAITGAIVVSFISGFTFGHVILPAPAPYSTPCTFGGGTIRNGSFAVSPAGATFFCSDGKLIRVTLVTP